MTQEVTVPHPIYPHTADVLNSIHCVTHHCQVVEALREARDIELHLRALQPHLDALGPDNTNLDEILSVLAPLFHALGLVWRHSKYYNRIDRVTVLLREIVNELIDHARAHIQPEEIFKVRACVTV